MENLSTVCRNPWCKATFFYTENDMIDEGESKVPPQVCKKCNSFNSELSGGVEWIDREYPKDYPNMRYHQIKYKVTNYRQ